MTPKKMLATTAPSAPPSTTASSASATASSKPPTTLLPGVWAAQIKTWENSFAPARRFPQTVLVGAENVLARMMHEHTVTTLYTPVRLGEILTTRSFTSSGQVNQLATKDREKEKSLGLDDSGNLTEKTNPSWDPRSILAILDGLEAVKWAYIFCDYGDEQTATKCTDHFFKLARNRQQDLQLVKTIWDSASWQVCLNMRINMTFKEATESLLADQHWFADAFNRYQPASPSPKKKPRTQFETSPFPWRHSGAFSDAASKGEGERQAAHTSNAARYLQEQLQGPRQGQGYHASHQRQRPQLQQCRRLQELQCGEVRAEPVLQEARLLQAWQDGPPGE